MPRDFQQRHCRRSYVASRRPFPPGPVRAGRGRHRKALDRHGRRGVRVVTGRSGVRVRVSGNLDASNADHLVDTVLSGLPPDHALVVDCDRLAFCDASGVTALVNLRNHQAEAGSAFSIINAELPVRRILEVCGLLEFLHVTPPSTDDGPSSA